MHGAWAGVDVGGTLIKIGLADSQGRMQSSEIIETRSCVDAESFLEKVCDKVLTLADRASVPLRGVGVGCPGRIDYKAGTVVWLKTKLEFLEGVSLAQRLSENLQRPVVCDNDVNAILAGEMRFGSGRGYQDVIAVTVGTGIGGALVLGGRLVRGHNWAAGHFGYMSLDPAGPRHVCGNTGIAEEYASQSGIQHQMQRAFEAGEVSPLTDLLSHGTQPGLREVFEAADANDRLGLRTSKQVLTYLGALIANLIYAVDPELVLVGGGIVNHRSGFLETVRREVSERLDYLPKNATKILPMGLGDSAGILGGVALAMEAFAPSEEGQ